MQDACGVANTTGIHGHVDDLLFDLRRLASITIVEEEGTPGTAMFAAHVRSVLFVIVRMKYCVGSVHGVTIPVIPNPKITGNGRYTYVAAWGSAIKAGGTTAQAKELVQRIFANVPVFDGGGRAATTTFAQRNIGDALCTFESEINLIKAEFGDHFDVVYPKSTILAENPVAVIDKVVDKKGTRKQAESYLKFLWSEEAQEIAARHQIRPRSPALLAKYATDFPKVQTFTVEEIFGGWTKAQKEHFDDGAIYDQILVRK